ncbi:WD40-repeat-containing domain protein [Polychytrium aggregatum]|uniref:WD40-repeat-containing domain protein n=1 Tax=Polychytrium aggregatum TaxID=110093 RepID=UPI0022FDCCFE|nr:WD40-repeat-containing domain protein [Polychytrium aggregatum]KAI9202562.1 WD40-repeat-containing domain protein [Polychytrium aggregatum]
MKVKIHQEAANKHTDLVTCVGWTSNNELFSCGDDQQMLRWSGDGEHLGAVPIALFSKSKTLAAAQKAGPSPEAQGSLYFTDIQWFPVAPSKGSSIGADLFVAAGTDGKFHLCTKAGRVEKSVEAHRGALLSLKWNYEGSALVTAGEDGQIKIYSRSGMLRSVLVQIGYPVYSIAWSPDNDQILFTNGRNLIIKPIQPSNKPNQWKAHDGVILKVDWSRVSNLIVSGGEDRKYKVWDTYGRQIYSSTQQDHPTTSVSWAPSGEMFAVGSFNTLRICDKLGWSYTLAKPKSGSIYNIAWTPDGTQLAGGGGSGAVVFANLVNRKLEWKNLEVLILDDHKIRVNDVVNGTNENLEFRDRVIQASIGFQHLIVATSSQCYVYSEKNWNTPMIVDLSNNGRVICIQQISNSYFLIVDNFAGIQIYSYDARFVSSPKYPGLRAEFITRQTISLSNDVLAITDRTDQKCIYLFDVVSGRAIGDGPLRHQTEVLEIGMNQSASAGVGRQLVLVDKNRDMHITIVMRPSFKKIGTMVETFIWNDEIDILAAIVDSKLVVWYYPNIVFVDEDISLMTRYERDGSHFGKNAQFTGFWGTMCTLRKADGASVSVSNISPFPGMLQDQTRRKQWEEAIRLCRFAKMNELWACLAGMAVHAQELNTAEVAYASIDEAAKVQFVCYVKSIPTPEGRAAELALLRRQPKESEAILLSASLIYRAIQMWITLFNWDRALEIAVKYKTHVDTVLYFRDRYLKAMGRKEANKRFLQYAEGVTVDYEKIKAKVAMEEESEKQRKNVKPYN